MQRCSRRRAARSTACRRAGAHGQTTNVAGVARDAGIARQTAQEFFQILVDTLLATWLPGTHDGAEVDFVVEGSEGLIAIEAKSATRWDARWNRGLQQLRAAQPKLVRSLLGVFDGERPQVADGVLVLPWRDFLRRLWTGELVG